MELNNQETSPQPPMESIPLTKPQYAEGQVLNKTFNASGPVDVVWRDGKQAFEPQQKAVDPDWMLNSARMKHKHYQAFVTILSYLAQRHQNKYPVPVMMQEVEQHVGKPAVKDLQKLGFIEIQPVTFQHNGKATGARTALWLTGAGEMLAKAMTQVAEKQNAENQEVPPAVPEPAAEVGAG